MLATKSKKCFMIHNIFQNSKKYLKYIERQLDTSFNSCNTILLDTLELRCYSKKQVRIK